MTLGHCPPEDALARYLTARLGDDEAARIDSHLSSCGSCSARLDQLSAQNGDAFLAVLRTAPGGRAESDEFDRDVAPRLRSRPRELPRELGNPTSQSKAVGRS